MIGSKRDSNVAGIVYVNDKFLCVIGMVLVLRVETERLPEWDLDSANCLLRICKTAKRDKLCKWCKQHKLR